MSDLTQAPNGESFDAFNLDTRIRAGITDAGYDVPTPIQQQAIPYILEGRDVLGLAQTGTGKTAAFMLPILQRLTRGPLRRPRVLIVSPTRELAEQTHETVKVLGGRTKVRSATVYGGVGKGPRLRRPARDLHAGHRARPRSVGAVAQGRGE